MSLINLSATTLIVSNEALFMLFGGREFCIALLVQVSSFYDKMSNYLLKC